MKFKTVLEYLIDEIKSDLDDIESIINNPQFRTRQIREVIGSIKDKLKIICE